MTTTRPLSRRALRVDLSREGRGEGKQYIGGGKTLPRRLPTSPLTGEVDARSAAGEGDGSTGDFARKLRTRMTEAEGKLWAALRARRFDHYKFRRQVPIGRYIVDFVCFERRLVIEVDGSQHEASQHDVLRDAWLSKQGFRVMRFWNADVLQAMDGAMLAILEALESQHP